MCGEVCWFEIGGEDFDRVNTCQLLSPDLKASTRICVLQFVGNY